MPQAQDLLEKLAEILLYNFHREHILLKLKIKKLLRKNKSKNLTAGVYFSTLSVFGENGPVIYVCTDNICRAVLNICDLEL